MDGRAVTKARIPRTAALSLLLGSASWVTLFWTTPAAFACSLVTGLLAAWFGWIAYKYTIAQAEKDKLSTSTSHPPTPSSRGEGIDRPLTAQAKGRPVFRAIFRSALGGTSGLITALLSVLVWVSVWPEIAARHAWEERAQALLTSITTQTGGSVQTELPNVSATGGVYADSVRVALTGQGKDSVICFTLDGSEPTTASQVYTAPLVINHTATLKAKAFRPGFQPSPVATETYLITDRDLTNFTSNLPVVLINTYGRPIYRDPSTKVFARFISPKGGRTRVTGAADYSGPAEMHVRGSSTLKFPKRSYTFTTVKEKVSIFGFPKDSDWVLYAPFQDKTLMRDVLAYELSRKMGHYSVRTRFVEVFMNSGGGRLTRGDYLGVYVFAEKIKRGKDRVNIEALTAKDNTEPKISGGYIFKRDHNDRNENGFFTRYGGPYYYVYPKEKEITREQKAWLRNYMDRFEAALYGSDFMDPTNGYRAYLDVDSFIDQHWLIEMSKNVDGFRYSVYFHKDRDGKLKLEPVWDWNLSFGNADFYGGWSTFQWYHMHLRPSEISWYRRLRQDPDFNQRCNDRWAQLRRNEFDTERIFKRIEEMATELRDAQARNFNRWGIMGQRVHANWFVGRTYRDEVDWMKRWIKDRMAWIDSQMVSGPRVSIKQANADGAARTLNIESARGVTYYTLDGSDPREPGGRVSPKAVLYNSPVAVQDGAQVFARVFLENTWSAPSTVRLTEVPIRAASLERSPAERAE